MKCVQIWVSPETESSLAAITESLQVQVDTAATVAMQCEAELNRHRDHCGVDGCKTENYLLELANISIDKQHEAMAVAKLVSDLRSQLAITNGSEVTS